MSKKSSLVITAVALAGCASFSDGEPSEHEGPVGEVTDPTGSGVEDTGETAAMAERTRVITASPWSVADAGAPSVTTGIAEPAIVSEGSCIETLLAATSDGGLDAGRARGDAAPDADPLEVDFGSGDLTVLVIFDKSGSMGSAWDGERTKWQVANEAFEKGLEGVLDLVTMGAVLFPQPGGCEVAPLDSELQFGFTSGRTFWTRWEQTEATRQPDGSTPLELALRTANESIEAACRQGLLEQRFRVLLVTDGEPTCGDDVHAIVDMASTWGRIGVEIRVLGLPGSSNAADLLNAIASGGGTLEYEAIESAGQLDDSVYQAVR